MVIRRSSLEESRPVVASVRGLLADLRDEGGEAGRRRLEIDREDLREICRRLAAFREAFGSLGAVDLSEPVREALARLDQGAPAVPAVPIGARSRVEVAQRYPSGGGGAEA